MLVVVEKGLFKHSISSNFQNATFETNYHNSDGSHSPPSVLFYRFVLNKINNNKHAEYHVIFIPFKGQRSTQNKAVMFLFCLGHGRIIFPYLGEAKVSTVNSDLTNFVHVNVFMKTNELCISNKV